MSIIVGQEVHLSQTNHPVTDICDELKGRYPKDFKFVGWHPFCRCYVTSILKTESEFLSDLNNGTDTPSRNAVTNVPGAFENWVEDNADRIKAADAKGTSPYFIRDNKKAVNDILNGNKREENKTPQQIAEERHAARTPEYIARIQQQWKERIDSRTIAQLIDGSVVPEMDYRTELPKRATLKDKLDNIIRGGIYYQGESGAFARWFKGFIGETYDRSTTQELIKRSLQFYRNDEIVELPTIEHLMSLRKFKDVEKIRPAWRKRYNELINELNSYDYTKGIKDIVPKIEEAHNIMMLSTNDKAIEYGLSKLSHRTPYQIFDEFEKAIPGFSNSCPKKEFFDMFSEYIPLFTGSEAGGAHYSPSRKHVIISLKEDAERLINSVWYRDGLFYHEYGHAFDNLNALRNNSELQKLYQKWKDKIKVDNGIALENSIKAKLKPHQDAFNDWWETSDVKKKHDEACKKARIGREYDKARKERKTAYNYEKQKVLGNLEEQIGCLSDCLMAFTSGTRDIIPRGHFGGYFSSVDLQLAEFIAHCSECFWSGNKYFKELAPDLYNAMVEWAKKAFNK